MADIERIMRRGGPLDWATALIPLVITLYRLWRKKHG